MPSVDARHCTTFNEAYLVTVWMRRYYARHHGVTSIQDAIAVGRTSFKHSVTTVAATDEGDDTTDDGVPHPTTSQRPQRDAGALLVPPQQLAALLSCCLSKRRTFSCCASGTCGSVASHSNGFHKFLAARRGSTTTAVPGSSVPWLTLPNSCISAHDACALRLRQSDTEVRIVPRADGRRHVTTRDDVVLCAALHVAAVGSPAPVRLRIQHYRQQPTIGGGGVGSGGGVEAREYEGLRAMLLAPCSPRWSSVTMYGIARDVDADTAGELLGSAIVAEGRRRTPQYEAAERSHEAASDGCWHRLALGTWAGTRGVATVLGSLVRTDFLQELILEDCLPAMMATDDRERPMHNVSDLCEYLFATRRSLRRLSLRNNPLAVAPMVARIGHACGTSRSLCSLDLALCGLHDAHVASLFVSLAVGRRQRSDNLWAADGLHLDLSHNSITSASLAALPSVASDGVAVGADVLAALVSLDVSGNPLYKQTSPPPRPPPSDGGGDVNGGSAMKTAPEHAATSPALLLMRLVTACPRLARLRANDSGLLDDPQASPALRSSGNTPGDLRRMAKAWQSNIQHHLPWWTSAQPPPSSAGSSCMPAPGLRVPWIATTATTTPSGDADVTQCDVELALGGCSHMSAADVRSVVVATHDAARGRSHAGEPNGGSAAASTAGGGCLRSALTLYAVPAVAAALIDNATTAALACLVVLDLRTCALGNEGAVHLGAAFERCAAVSPLPMALEVLLLSDNSLGYLGGSCAASQGLVTATTSSGGKRGAGGTSSGANKRKDGMQFLCKGLRGSVLPRLRHLDVSFNGLVAFRPLVVLMEQAAASFCSLNLSGHAALQWSEGTVGPPPPADGGYEASAGGTMGMMGVTYARTAFGRAPVVELALAVQTRLLAASESATSAAVQCGGSGGGASSIGNDFRLTLRDCNCDALGAFYGTVGLRIVT